MTIDQAKQELVRRYRFLYENAYFILAPYMYEQSKEKFENMVKKDTEKYGRISFTEPLIYLNISTLDDINSLFEEFLLSDKPMEESKLYKLVNSKRNDKEYLEQVKKGLELLEKLNTREACNKENLSIWKILNATSDYIIEQSGDLKNKKRKLSIIDEYYRIARYQNDGKIYTSGRELTLHDVSSITAVPLHQREPFRDKKDVGITKNSFITAISNAPFYKDNRSIFSEREKQQIYLDYHDELPCNLEITCTIEEPYIETKNETRLHRPENTEPCGKKFIIREEEIFVNPSNRSYRYYQLCPHCGFIVNIPKEILSEGIKQRIEDRCIKDDKLFRKMFLYSELFSLDKKSNKEQKKLLKK